MEVDQTRLDMLVPGEYYFKIIINREPEKKNKKRMQKGNEKKKMKELTSINLNARQVCYSLYAHKTSHARLKFIKVLNVQLKDFFYGIVKRFLLQFYCSFDLL